MHRVTHHDVYVTPAGSGAALAPFWRAEERHRGFEVSEQVGLFLETIEGRLDDRSLPEALSRSHALEPGAAHALVGFLRESCAALGGVLPHRRRIVVERAAGTGTSGPSLVFHTLWGGRVNRPFAMALEAAWAERHGTPLETAHDDDCIAIDALEPPELQPVGYEIINLGGHQAVKINDLIRQMEALIGKKAQIEQYPAHPADVFANHANVEKAGRLLGWEPTVSLEEGVSRLIAWYNAECDWASQLKTA